MKNFFIGAVLLVLFTIVIGAMNTDKETVIINRIEQQQNITSDSNGNTRSEVVYMVYTSGKTYEIEQSGLFAHPEYIGEIHEGDTLEIESKMFNCPILGLYKTITKIK